MVAGAVEVGEGEGAAVLGVAGGKGVLYGAIRRDAVPGGEGLEGLFVLLDLVVGFLVGEFGVLAGAVGGGNAGFLGGDLFAEGLEVLVLAAGAGDLLLELVDALGQGREVDVLPAQVGEVLVVAAAGVLGFFFVFVALVVGV